MINPAEQPLELQDQTQLTVFSLCYDSSWCGVRAKAFLTQEEAEHAWIDAVTSDRRERVELRQLRVRDEQRFVEQMDELRNPMENYCIRAHRLDVAVPSRPVEGVVRFSRTTFDVKV